MHVTDFLGAIKSPSLRDIALHWNAVRGAKRIPAWKDIDPAAIAPYLSIVWSWKYDRERDTFTGRLAGATIIDAHGANLRGKQMQEFFTGRGYERIFAKYRRVVTGPAFAREDGQVFSDKNRYGLGERIIMPLADDGKNGDGVFGATTYSIHRNAPRDKPRPLETGPIDFFALD